MMNCYGEEQSDIKVVLDRHLLQTLQSHANQVDYPPSITNNQVLDVGAYRDEG